MHLSISYQKVQRAYCFKMTEQLCQLLPFNILNPTPLQQFQIVCQDLFFFSCVICKSFIKSLQGSSCYFFLLGTSSFFFSVIQVLYQFLHMSNNQKGLSIYNRNKGQTVISTNSFTKIKGQISKGTFLIDPSDLQGFSTCLKNQAISKYGNKLTPYVLNAIGNLNKKLFYQLNKNWIIFRDDNGNISYYGFLKRNVRNMVMVGVYEFSIDFTIDKNVHIKRFQKYEEQTSFFGGTDSVYITIDQLQVRSRGLSKKDFELLFHFTKMIENEFSITDLEGIK